jgi:hypothetical protein
MENLLENIKEVREELDGLFCGLDVAATDEERKVMSSVERKLASIEKEVGTFFSGQI